jgi:hypothetical protein
VEIAQLSHPHCEINFKNGGKYMYIKQTQIENPFPLAISVKVYGRVRKKSHCTYAFFG